MVNPVPSLPPASLRTPTLSALGESPQYQDQGPEPQMISSSSQGMSKYIGPLVQIQGQEVKATDFLLCARTLS